jgi:hypothetical protein
VLGDGLVDAYREVSGSVQGVAAVAIVGFVAVLVLWLTFGGTLLLRREALDEAWHSFQHQPRIAQGLEAVSYSLGSSPSRCGSRGGRSPCE